MHALLALPLIVAAASPARTLWITSDGEPVDASVHVVALEPEGCPCDPARVFARAHADRSGVGDCMCPAALARMRARLDRCTAPRVIRTVHGARSDIARRGVLSVEARAVVDGEPRVAWVSTAHRGDLSVELRPALQPRFSFVQQRADFPAVDPAVSLAPTVKKAALLYGDGRCVTLMREGDAFLPVVTVPRDTPAYAVFLDADGVLTPWYWHAYNGVDVEVRNAPIDTVRGTCAPHTIVRAVHAFVDQETTSDELGAFSLALPRGPAIVTCGEARWAVEGAGWLRDLPRAGAREEQAATRAAARARAITEDGRAKRCAWLRVADASGAAIAAAEVTAWGETSHVEDLTSDAGEVCLDVARATEVVVRAPRARGGACAAELRMPAPAATGARQDVRLALAPLARTHVELRVLSPEGHPVAGAVVWAPGTKRGACSATSPASPLLYTDVDGTVQLDDVWVGDLSVLVRHDAWAYQWFHVDAASDRSERTVTLERGASITGRVRDPSGAPVSGCSAVLREERDARPDAVDRAYWSACRGDRFSFRGVPPGAHTIEVRAPDEGGVHRAFSEGVTIAKDAAHTVELQWPRGKSIRGVVVDAKGAPVPRARIDAYPEGAQLIEGRFTVDEIQLYADDTGQFVILDVRDGRWVLSASRGHAQLVIVDAGASGVRVVAVDPP